MKIYSAFFFLIFLSASISGAVTNFCPDTEEKSIPAFFEFSDIRFYDRAMSKVRPEIDLNWLTLVFRSDAKTAKEILRGHDHVTDVFYDANLAQDACFLKLREGMNKHTLQQLIAELNQNEFVSYAHPALVINGRTYAFFNAFEMEWKTGVSSDIKKRLMNQADISWDEKETIYRVNLFQTPFFSAVNLLAEDIHVLHASPYLAELKPPVRAELIPAINGAHIGDKIPFSLNITFSDLIRIDPSSLATINLRPADIQKALFEAEIDPYDSVKAVSESPIRITGRIAFYTPGEFTIPSVKIKFTCSHCSGNPVRTVETTAVPFKVSSIVPSGENKLIIPEKLPMPEAKSEYYRQQANINLILSVLSFLISLICVARFIGKWYAAKQEREELQAKTNAVLFSENLKQFLNDPPFVPHWTYMAEAGKLLRGYLTEKYQITEYPGRGTGEMFFESVRQSFPEQIAPQIGRIFKTVDDAAAIELNTYSDMEGFKAELIEILRY
jgi:hypothetical protein